jgi:4-alpha-glucanotransferase
MRASGILLPVSSLPSPYGIGCFSREALEWIDFLKKSGQKYWQILPLGPVSYGDSPYQSFSTFAGNPLYISLEGLVVEGLLSREECEAAELDDGSGYVDYGRQFQRRYQLLYQAYQRSGCQQEERYHIFCRANQSWLEDYALFMALKEENDWRAFTEWDEELRLRRPAAVREALTRLGDRVEFYSYLQYLFDQQWSQVRRYANENGIRIIGDIPIYVSMDSSDVWTRPELFQLDENRHPTAVAGCPPDAFSADGQLWGNPLYDWDAHRKEAYRWWLDRIRHCAKLYDVVRIDHFRGFDSYYSIPWGDETAKNGSWEPGPGMELFRYIQKEIPDLAIIAEDLGFMTDSVRQLVRDSGYPNMKVLQFAFGSDASNEYLPFWYERNCVVYTGTHDNETLLQHIESAGEREKDRIREYTGLAGGDDRALCDGVIRMAFASVADTCIIPMQDYLQTGAEGRMNYPSTLGGNNWKWRMKKEDLTDARSAAIRHLTELYAR